MELQEVGFLFPFILVDNFVVGFLIQDVHRCLCLLGVVMKPTWLFRFGITAVSYFGDLKFIFNYQCFGFVHLLLMSIVNWFANACLFGSLILQVLQWISLGYKILCYWVVNPSEMVMNVGLRSRCDHSVYR